MVILMGNVFDITIRRWTRTARVKTVGIPSYYILSYPLTACLGTFPNGRFEGQNRTKAARYMRFS